MTSAGGSPAAGGDDYLRRRVRNDPARALRELVSPRVAYLDLRGDTAKSIFVLASARSGSTLMAELLAGTRQRIIFEPLRAHRVKMSRDFRRGQFLEPGTRDPELHHLLHRVLTGRIRNLWVDAHNTVRWPAGRVVKEVRANNLAPWLVAEFPEVPIVYLLRHPLATAVSASELSRNDQLDELVDQTDLMAHFEPARELIDRTMAEGRGTLSAWVLRWCLENALPVSRVRPGSVHVVFYEDLVVNRAAELDRLAGFLGEANPARWGDWRAAPSMLDRPSRSSWRDGDRTPSTAERVGGWRQAVDDCQLDEALELLRAFGLDRVYGAGPSPLLAPDRLLLDGPTG
jgi:hypothetical protein